MLTATSAYRHAICSKDDLVITGGTYVVDAVEDALPGNDCVKVADGDFTLTAGGDGIKSNNDGDATRGFVPVDGAFDYDLTATVTGGTVLVVGSAGMAQNFTSGTQPFAFATASGSAGQSVAVADADGTVVASLTAAKQFGMGGDPMAAGQGGDIQRGMRGGGAPA